MKVFLSFGEALLLTVAVEAAVAWLLGLRSWKEQVVLLLVNVITNPSLNLLVNALAFFGVYAVRSPYDPMLLLMEAAVVVGEAATLRLALKKSPARCLLISLAANLASWLTGALILWR